MPAPPAGQTIQSTLPYGVGTLPCLMIMWVGPAAIAAIAGAGSSLAARPRGYRDGAEDATTVPSAAVATTAGTRLALLVRAAVARTAHLAGRARPGQGG